MRRRSLMAASRPCPRWDLFFHAPRSRYSNIWRSNPTSSNPTIICSTTSRSSFHSIQSPKSATFCSTTDLFPEIVTRSTTQRQPFNRCYPTFTRRVAYSTPATLEEAKAGTDSLHNGPETPVIRKRGRPPGTRNKRVPPMPLPNRVHQGSVDAVGIPFGYRRDVASKWKDLAGLNTDENLYHRNIWWLWLDRCNGAWTESEFDVSKAWTQQNLDKRVIARESVRRYVYDEELTGIHMPNESHEWKENVKRVLGSDAGIDFKLGRIHGSYRRAWKLVKDKEQAIHVRRQELQ